MIPQIIAANAKTVTTPKKLTMPIDSTKNPTTTEANKTTRLPIPRNNETVAIHPHSSFRDANRTCLISNHWQSGHIYILFTLYYFYLY